MPLNLNKIQRAEPIKTPFKFPALVAGEPFESRDLTPIEYTEATQLPIGESRVQWQNGITVNSTTDSLQDDSALIDSEARELLSKVVTPAQLMPWQIPDNPVPVNENKWNPEHIEIRKSLEELTDAELIAELESEADYRVDEYDDYVDEKKSIEPGDYLDPSLFVRDDMLGPVGFELDPSQQIAVEGMVNESYACLIGAAGTGKTTTTKAVVRTLIAGDAARGIEPLRLVAVDIQQYHKSTKAKAAEEDSEEPALKVIIPSIALVAFTGQATQVLKKNMPKGWAKNCMTIHSLLGYAPETYQNENNEDKVRFVPTYTMNNKMPWDVIFIDEASMVALQLYQELLAACKSTTRIYMIGDLNQLPPPIGAGILGFALSRWPVFELTKVHRQADDAANRIVDSAHRILRGQMPEFDDPSKERNWRVIGFQLDANAEKAHRQIIGLAVQLSKQKVHESVDASQPMVYNPMRDRILTPMNGFNDGQPSALLGQFPLNDALARIFVDPEQPRIIIDYKKGTKRFAVGYRVMATKNEGPGVEDRVTNGLTGVITEIIPNQKWLGDRRLVGAEDEVKANRMTMMRDAQTRQQMIDSVGDFHLSVDTTLVPEKTAEESKQGGPCSHIVEVKFANGATRRYSMNAQIEQLFIAYASTVHKAQGAEMPLAIIVIHNLQRQMLNRELLYTAITRASQRVLILYTDLGMRIALSNQKISGTTLKEKIRQYQDLLGDTENTPFRVLNVPLKPEDVNPAAGYEWDSSSDAEALTEDAPF